MNRTILFISVPALILLGCLIVFTQESARTANSADTAVSTAPQAGVNPFAVSSSTFAWRKETNSAFASSEKLKFEVHLGIYRSWDRFHGSEGH